jgi:hypothetical protein
MSIMASDLVYAAPSTSTVGGALMTWVAFGLIAMVVLDPFRRRIGGAGGGSEPAAVGGIWVIAAVATALFIAR